MTLFTNTKQAQNDYYEMLAVSELGLLEAQRYSTLELVCIGKQYAAEQEVKAA